MSSEFKYHLCCFMGYVTLGEYFPSSSLSFLVKKTNTGPDSQGLLGFLRVENILIAKFLTDGNSSIHGKNYCS